MIFVCHTCVNLCSIIYSECVLCLPALNAIKSRVAVAIKSFSHIHAPLVLYIEIYTLSVARKLVAKEIAWMSLHR